MRAWYRMHAQEAEDILMEADKRRQASLSRSAHDAESTSAAGSRIAAQQQSHAADGLQRLNLQQAGQDSDDLAASHAAAEDAGHVSDAHEHTTASSFLDSTDPGSDTESDNDEFHQSDHGNAERHRHYNGTVSEEERGGAATAGGIVGARGATDIVLQGLKLDNIDALEAYDLPLQVRRPGLASLCFNNRQP